MSKKQLSSVKTPDGKPIAIVKGGDLNNQIIYLCNNDNKTELYFQIYKGRTLLNPEGWIAR